MLHQICPTNSFIVRIVNSDLRNRIRRTTIIELNRISNCSGTDALFKRLRMDSKLSPSILDETRRNREFNKFSPEDQSSYIKFQNLDLTHTHTHNHNLIRWDYKLRPNCLRIFCYNQFQFHLLKCLLILKASFNPIKDGQSCKLFCYIYFELIFLSPVNAFSQSH